MPQLSTRTLALAATAVVVLFLGATLVATELLPRLTGADRYANCRKGRVAGGIEVGGPFTLVDGTGRTVTDAEVLTEPTLLYFGYTFCPDACPLDLSRNATAVDLLEERGLKVRPVFISLDPARDTPQVVRDYAAAMHPRMIGLTGTPEQVKSAAAAYRVYFKKREGDDPEFYLVDHTTFTYLVLPGEGVVDFFRSEDAPEQVAERVACYLAQ